MQTRDDDSSKRVAKKQGTYEGFGGGAAESAAAIREAYGAPVPPINMKRGSDSRKNRKNQGRD